MQMIFYAGGTFLTGDDIADGLLAYSRALGDEDAAQLVEIPILDDDGSRNTARFLLGPASQIVTKPVRTDGEELRDPHVVEQLQRLARGVSFPEASHSDEDDHWAHGDHP